MNKAALKKALLEVGRVILLAVLAWLLTGGAEALVSSLELSPSAKVQVVAVLVLIFRGLDKWVHELGKADSSQFKEDWKVKGITRF